MKYVEILDYGYYEEFCELFSLGLFCDEPDVQGNEEIAHFVALRQRNYGIENEDEENLFDQFDW